MFLIFQELLWHVVNNVDIEGSKVPLFARSPFLEFETVVPEGSRDMILGTTPGDKRDLIEKINFHSIAYAESVKKIVKLQPAGMQDSPNCLSF